MLICLHIGAHKTASTYMQAKLTEEREKLAQYKIGMVSHDFFRRSLADKLDAASGLGGVGYAALKPGFSGFLRRMAAKNLEPGHERLVMSDENLAGSILSAIGPDGLYPDVKRRLSVVASSMPKDHDLKVFFCVRSYAEYFSSIYAYRKGQRKAQEVDVFRSRALELRRGWTDVVTDICDVVGPDNAVVWTYEEFARLPARVNYAMLGDWRPRLFVKSDRASLPSLTRKGLAVLDRAADLLSEKEHAGLARVVARFAFDAPDEKFSLFGADEIARLAERYEQDLAAIDRMGCRLETPEPPSVGQASAAVDGEPETAGAKAAPAPALTA